MRFSNDFLVLCLLTLLLNASHSLWWMGGDTRADYRSDRDNGRDSDSNVSSIQRLLSDISVASSLTFDVDVQTAQPSGPRQFMTIQYFTSSTCKDKKGIIGERDVFTAGCCMNYNSTAAMMMSFDVINNSTVTITQELYSNMKCLGQPGETIVSIARSGCSGYFLNYFNITLTNTRPPRPSYPAIYYDFYVGESYCEHDYYTGYDLSTNLCRSISKRIDSTRFNFAVCNRIRRGSTSMMYKCVDGLIEQSFYAGPDCNGRPSTVYTPSICEQQGPNASTTYMSRGCQGASQGWSPKPLNFSMIACFAAAELITLEGGSTLPISAIKIGDRVLASNSVGVTIFSDVIAIPHAHNDIVGDFVEIITVTGRSLRITPEHVMVAGACDVISSRRLSLILAGTVTIGSCLLTVEGFESVTSVSILKSVGIYTIVTMDEYLVVNGFVASPFAVSHSTGNAFYNLYRGLYKIASFTITSEYFVSVHQRFSDHLVFLLSRISQLF